MKSNLVHIDILTPKQVMFFAEIVKDLGKHGVDVLLTSRRYRELEYLLSLKQLKHVMLGAHGGGELYSKAKNSLQRTSLLLDLLHERKPGVSVSFSSPEAARASFGLGIPHICISDSPHAQAVSKLTVPLSRKLLTPRVVPKKAWIPFGIKPQNIIQYNALDPFVWLSPSNLNPKALLEYGLNQSKPIVLVRLEESQAAYLLEKQLDASSRLRKWVEAVLSCEEEAQIVMLPRYEDQITLLKRIVGSRGVVLRQVVDGPSLLSHATVFIGGGGTMTAEAALLGIPCYSCYRGPSTYVERFLLRRGLVKHVDQPDALSRKLQITLKNLSSQRTHHQRLAEKLMTEMVNPLPMISREICSLLPGF